MSVLSFPPLPTSLDELCSLALRLISRLTQQGDLERATGIRRCLEPALIRHREYLALRTEPAKVLSPAIRRADAALVQFILDAKASLKPALGPQPSEAWAQAGFSRQSLAMPPSSTGRESLVRSLGQFLRDHPEFESAATRITAAHAGHLITALHAARLRLHTHGARQRAAQAARKKACSALRKRLKSTLRKTGSLLF